MTRYQPSTRNTRTDRDGRAFAAVALVGVLAILVVAVVIVASLFAQITDQLHEVTDQPTPAQCIGGAS